MEHVYFYRAAVADPETLRGYLDRAYRLGTDFASSAAPAAKVDAQPQAS